MSQFPLQLQYYVIKILDELGEIFNGCHRLLLCPHSNDYSALFSLEKLIIISIWKKSVPKPVTLWITISDVILEVVN